MLRGLDPDSAVSLHPSAVNSPGLRWTCVSVEMEPEGVLVHLLGNDTTGPDSALWHMADVRRALTLCGLDVGYGKPRLPWSETPEHGRCQMCVAQLGGRNRPRI